MALLYSTFLSSYTISPATQLSELSFKDMLQQNFRFISNSVTFEKERAEYLNNVLDEKTVQGKQKALELLRQEVVLGDKVKQAINLSIR